MAQRLQKFMAEAGVASRRHCEDYIRAGRVQVNGVVASIGATVEPGVDEVMLDGAVLTKDARRIVILFYKPRGVVSTSHDPQGRKTVQDYFRDIDARLYNIGRLDVNTEGLLLMTNDGALAERLTHPRYKIPKTYYVVIDGTLTGAQAQALINGVMLDDGMTAPAKLTHIRPTKTGRTCFLLTIREGRNRQVRRMVEAVGHKTLLLKREQVGPLTLGAIAPGQWRYATQAELAALNVALEIDKN